MTEAPFTHVSDAVSWAFATLHRVICKTSSLKDWRGAEVSSDLTPYEAHAQAAMILAHVDALPEIERAFILAKHLPPQIAGQARTPKQFKEVKDEQTGELVRGKWRRWLRGQNPGRREALQMLARHVQARLGQRSGMPAFLLLVDQYFATKRQGVGPLRTALKLRKAEALAMRSRGFETLELLDVAAESRLHYSFLVDGMVPGMIEGVR